MLLGIDFGTCNTSAALVLNGTTRLIKEPLKHGYSFPSSVYLTEGGEVLVGQAAENNRMLDIRRYRREFKRDLGINEPYLIGERSLLPQNLVADVLRKLKIEAEKIVTALGQRSIENAVITVPATYQQYKCNLMQKAAEAAGFRSVKLLEEPVAAAIYYTHHNKNKLQDGEKILVYDLGGGTFDATLIKQEAASYQILSTPKGLENCGGTDFDRLIYQDIKNRCSEALRQQLNNKDASQGRATISKLCIDIKHQLSEAQEARIYIPIGGEDYQLTRADFNQMIAPSIDQTIAVCDQLIKNAGIDWQDINQVLLVGGSCRIVYVQDAIEKKLGHPPLLIDEPELCVCQGAAIYGTELNTKPKPIPEEQKKQTKIKHNVKIPSTGDPFDAFGEEAVFQHNDNANVDDWF
ncbi:Hsp70 family protein [Nostoc sp. FACHB-87]|uniref:Hsp70 family protein n=1 Tax=Nostocaceae TaxID=1162 RepID=UPI0016866B3C|nr:MULTISPECIES: Hsp70 family protein [Nostocaceae]MBD2459198.1 Hsp70 family protein [Nostoc sp. FACHB-87]MBD2480208.1 Hsp70 family protein [Anabaena sp. FACHB-83]